MGTVLHGQKIKTQRYRGHGVSVLRFPLLTLCFKTKVSNAEQFPGKDLDPFEIQFATA